MRFIVFPIGVGLALSGFHIFYASVGFIAHFPFEIRDNYNRTHVLRCKTSGGTPVYYQEDGNYTGCKHE